MTGSGRQAGFTLIELLVSLVVLGFAAALLVAAVSTGHGLGARAEAKAAAVESIDAAQTLLRDRLTAMTAEARFDASVPYADMRGDNFVLSFTAPAIDAAQPAPLQRYRLQLARGTLTLFAVDPLRRDIQPDAPTLAGWTQLPLLLDAAGLDIAYFGAAPPDGERRWRRFWQNRPQLPELVRVRVGFAPGDRRVWPDLIVRPAATVSTACQLDSLTGRCRATPS